MNFIIKFIHFNQKICALIEPRLPHAKSDITLLYDSIVADYINHKKGQIVVDLGSGREIPYATKLNPNSKFLLIAVDTSLKELSLNKDADKKIVTDLNSATGLPDHYANLITSRYLLEHLQEPNTFVKNMHQTLKKNGKVIFLFSSRNAPFAILNRLLPSHLSQRLLLWFVPDSKDLRGFKTHYKFGYHNTIKLFQQNGFKIFQVYLSYYQSRYFAFFVPLYLLSVIYELIIFKLKLKNLASYIIIIAQKH